jgi:hypothetical protein
MCRLTKEIEMDVSPVSRSSSAIGDQYGAQLKAALAAKAAERKSAAGVDADGDHDNSTSVSDKS